jgi:hypothetical protein
LFDGEAFGQQMAEYVREYVAGELEAVLAENAALKANNEALAARIEKIEEEAKADNDRAIGLYEAHVKFFDRVQSDAVLATIEDVEAVIRHVDETIAAAFSIMPIAKDGVDADMDAIRSHIDATVTKELDCRLDAAVAATIPQPAEVDMDRVGELVENCVANAMGALPPPAAGKDCDMDRVSRELAELVDQAVKALPVAKDGVGLAGALIDREGNLVITLTDGSQKELGIVVGKDGKDGKNGEPGKTFTLDDFDIVPYDDERTFKFCFTAGDMMHSFELHFPVVLDRGVWSAARADGGEYVKGDGVSWGGSWWIAQKDSPQGKPDTVDSGWRLAVKRGHPGKDAGK